MADNSSDYSNQNSNASGSPQNQFRGLQLTEEEMKVLKECRTYSLYYRGIPAGILSLIAARYLSHNHFPHMKRWSGFYYTGALGLGMAAGIASYRQKCFEKIMSLDNSRLADEVRKYQQRFSGQASEQSGSELDNDRDFMSQQQQIQTRPQVDDHRSFKGGYRTNDPQDLEENEPQPTSYEELRKRHRESRMHGPRRLAKVPQREAENTVDSETYDPDTTYDRRETYSPGSPWDSSAPQTSAEQKGKYAPQQWPQAKKDYPRRNKYGDEME